MSIIQTFKTYSGYRSINNWTRTTFINPQAKITVHDFLKVFWIRVMKGNFPLRSAAVSWIIFFSMFPFLLFLFSVLPKLPYYLEIKNLLFTQFLPQLLPEQLSKEVIGYIDNTTTSQGNKKVDWYLILVTIFMSSNAIQGIINSFNVSYQSVYVKRKEFRSRIISIVLTLFFTAFIILQVFISYYTSMIWKYLTNVRFLSILGEFSHFVNYLSIFGFYFISMCMLYTFGPNHKKSKSTVIPGAILTSLLFTLTVIGFNLYLKKFTNIDLLYGSLGLVMIMMIFVYINVILMLVGYELNMSIAYAKNYDQVNSISRTLNIIKLKNEGNNKNNS
ncbi:YihY/virulence factor BrkB family protein [Faecalibacter rhinopitheci]|uniref:YihY/virulence factor BrkB family protein n=1 Tax=Faecalibacter rhinopitheci TaxID=2779678 RepID=A0A8J7KCN1_9FLAO|nr:YihY/virulence factor BrkB family protein [Faecalibacter rhinopitheci]MBF0596446.1 YihY/virulence factor BrkB family protein [Faecalibacter rhinopitheci]MBQ0147382.1 YihY/virulence factor BrkB family protein [Candidatus Onthonaster equi]